MRTPHGLALSAVEHGCHQQEHPAFDCSSSGLQQSPCEGEGVSNVSVVFSSWTYVNAPYILSVSATHKWGSATRQLPPNTSEAPLRRGSPRWGESRADALGDEMSRKANATCGPTLTRPSEGEHQGLGGKHTRVRLHCIEKKNRTFWHTHQSTQPLGIGLEGRGGGVRVPTYTPPVGASLPQSNSVRMPPSIQCEPQAPTHLPLCSPWLSVYFGNGFKKGKQTTEN